MNNLPRESARRRHFTITWASAALALALASGCGGGGGGGGDGDGGAPAPTPPAGPTEAERVAAASATAQSAANACNVVRPFYWEVGDRTAARTSGSVDAGGGAPTYTAASSMNIASASKWLYAAYVAQRRGAGGMTPDDVAFLTFRSGYTNFATCLPGQSVDGCLAYLNNDVRTPANEGLFFYDGGHMQKHASASMGLGALGNAALAAEMLTQLGSDVGMSYSQPQLAGGVVSTAADYARFLRRLLDGSLRLGSQLGSNAVCASPTACPTQAVSSPMPGTERWDYSLGHWVESDPVVGDGAFSSAGAFGFYPWIDAGRTFYGVLARESFALGSGQQGYASAQCGRLIRKAWLTGVAR